MLTYLIDLIIEIMKRMAWLTCLSKFVKSDFLELTGHTDLIVHP